MDCAAQARTSGLSGDRQFTYVEFGERCERFAAALRRAGVQKGDRVAFLSFNNHQLIEGYYAAPMAEAVAMPLNVRLTASELRVILQHSGVRVLFHEPDFDGIAAELPVASRICFSSMSSFTSLPDFTVGTDPPSYPTLLLFSVEAANPTTGITAKSNRATICLT